MDDDLFVDRDLYHDFHVSQQRLNAHAWDPSRRSWGWLRHENLRRDAWPYMPYALRPDPKSIGFTLPRARSIPCRPRIDVILGFGPPSTTRAVCQQFARDSEGWYHLDVQEYLLSLRDDVEKDPQTTKREGMLCDVISPEALASATHETNPTMLSPRTIMTLLLKKIDVEAMQPPRDQDQQQNRMAQRRRKFIITGLASVVQNVILFMEIIADPNAVFLFYEQQHSRIGISDAEANTKSPFHNACVEFFAANGQAVEVGIARSNTITSKAADEAYASLLRELGKKAMQDPIVAVATKKVSKQSAALTPSSPPSQSLHPHFPAAKMQNQEVSSCVIDLCSSDEDEDDEDEREAYNPVVHSKQRGGGVLKVIGGADDAEMLYVDERTPFIPDSPTGVRDAHEKSTTSDSGIVFSKYFM